jgi:hypothetical protein
MRSGIRKSAENIEISEKKWILIIYISERIFNIGDVLISREIIIKKLPSSSNNRIFSLKYFHPKLWFSHGGWFTHATLYVSPLDKFRQKVIIRENIYTSRSQIRDELFSWKSPISIVFYSVYSWYVISYTLSIWESIVIFLESVHERSRKKYSQKTKEGYTVSSREYIEHLYLIRGKEWIWGDYGLNFSDSWDIDEFFWIFCNSYDDSRIYSFPEGNRYEASEDNSLSP